MPAPHALSSPMGNGLRPHPVKASSSTTPAKRPSDKVPVVFVMFNCRRSSGEVAWNRSSGLDDRDALVGQHPDAAADVDVDVEHRVGQKAPARIDRVGIAVPHAEEALFGADEAVAL